MAVKKLLRAIVRLPEDLYKGEMPVEAYKDSIPVRELTLYLDPSELNGESPEKRAARWAFFAPGNKNGGFFYNIMSANQKKGNLFFEDYVKIEEVPAEISQEADEIRKSIESSLKNIEVSAVKVDAVKSVLPDIGRIGDAAVGQVVRGVKPSLDNLRKYLDDDGTISNILTEEEEVLYSGGKVTGKPENIATKPISTKTGVGPEYKSDKRKRPSKDPNEHPELFTQPKKELTEEEMLAVFQRDTDEFRKGNFGPEDLSPEEYKRVSMAEAVDLGIRAKGVATDIKPLSHEIKNDYKPPLKKKARYWKHFVTVRRGGKEITLIYERGSTREKRLQGLKKIKSQNWDMLDKREREARETGKLRFYYCPDDAHYGSVTVD